MLDNIKEAIERIDNISGEKRIKVISHFDSDGITAGAIFSRALERWGKIFSLEIVKGLDKEYIKELDGDELLIFLDLGSGNLNDLMELKNEVLILDHHIIEGEPSGNVFMVNPRDDEKISAAAICYLFAKELDSKNVDLANLAVIGMVGDNLDMNMGESFKEILEDSESTIKESLLIYPSTRPLDRALEYCSNPYIPGVSGSKSGVIKLLSESDIKSKKGKYKSLCELDEEETSRLIKNIMLKCFDGKEKELIGNLFLIKFFNNLEDARELSALINACGRMGKSEIALGFCLGNKASKEVAENAHIEYRQNLVNAMKYVHESEKVEGKDYMIINARDKIKDTIIGTVASILSHSPLYPEGKVIVALAYNEDKIKVSARLTGRKGDRNVRDVLFKVVEPLGGEVGGHPNAAGCMIDKEKEEEFIGELKRVLDVSVVKV